MKNIVYNEKLYVRPNVVMIVLCLTKFKLYLTKIGIWSDVRPVKKKYLFAALHGIFIYKYFKNSLTIHVKIYGQPLGARF